MNVKLTNTFWGTVAASVIAGGILIYLQNKNAFNPVSKDNLANQGFESIIKATTGSEDPGGDAWSKTHNPDGSVKLWASPLWILDRVAGLPDKGISF